MTLLGMALRSLRARRTVALLTVLGLALAVALPSVVLIVREQAEAALLQEGEGVDLVVGGKGSGLQLVLSVVHHLDQPTGNMPYALYETLREDARISHTVPFALGDNVMGFRIVGTRPSFFDWEPRTRTPTPQPWATLRSGRPFSEAFEVVIGDTVARSLGLSLGDSFVGSHGLRFSPGTEHADFPYTVVGIFAPTGGTIDRLVIGTLEAVWAVHEADEDFHRNLFQGVDRGPQPREVTAVWLRLRSPGTRLWMQQEINRTTDAMAAIPVDELHRLHQRVLRPVERGMLAIAAAVALVSGLSVLTTQLQAALQRRRDRAVLRMLGARPAEVLWLIWLETFWMTAAGLLLGLLAAHGGLALAGPLLPADLLPGLNPWTFAPWQGRVLLGVGVLSLACGLLPALLVYHRSPVEALQNDN